MVWLSDKLARKAGLSVYQHLQNNAAAVIAATQATQGWKTNPVGLIYLPFHGHTAPFDDGPSKKITDYQIWVQDALWTKTLPVPSQLIYKLMKIGVGLPHMLEAFAQRVKTNDVPALQIIGQNLAKHHLQPASEVLGQLMTYINTKEEQEEVKHMMGWDFNALHDLFLYLVTQQYLPDELEDVVSGIRCLAHVLNDLDVADLHIEGPAKSNADMTDGCSDTPVVDRIMTTALSGNRYATYNPMDVPTAHPEASEAATSEAGTGLRFGRSKAAKPTNISATQQSSDTAGAPTSQRATSVFGNSFTQHQLPIGTATSFTSAQQQTNAFDQDSGSGTTTGSSTQGFGVNTHPTATLFGTQPTDLTTRTFGVENNSPGINTMPAQTSTPFSGLTGARIDFGSTAKTNATLKTSKLYAQRIGSTPTPYPSSGDGHGTLTPNLFNTALNPNTNTYTPLPKLGGDFGARKITPTSVSGSAGDASVYHGSNPTLKGGSGAGGLFGSTSGKPNVGFGRGI